MHKISEHELKENIMKLECDLRGVKSYKELNDLKTIYLGKNSYIKFCLKELMEMNEEDKKEYGKIIHNNLSKIEELFQNFKLKIANFDCTLPVYYKRGKENMLNKVIKEIKDIMISMGFTFFYQKDIVDEWSCFDSLNINTHPCRDVFQSFFLKTNSKFHIMSPHTSSIQNYVLRNHDQIKAFSIGSAFRRDSDATHSPMFHQIEAIVIDESSNMRTLLDYFPTFFSAFLNQNIKCRVRSSFFPFTSPSMEVDIFWNNRWLEVGGCGVVHPNVLKLAERKEYQPAYALAFGIERLAMIKYKIDDIREFYAINK
jgi:phenylalanyl-tRNA synthetase alpha chain